MEGQGGPEDVEDSQKSQKQQISCEILKMLKFLKFLDWVFPDVETRHYCYRYLQVPVKFQNCHLDLA